MSDEEDNYNINKNRISEEEEEEEKEENKEGNNNSNIKVNLSDSNINNSSANQEENEESEEYPKIVEKSTPNDRKSSKNKKNEKMTKEKYIAMIEELNNELKLEKKINGDLGDNTQFTEVQKLKNELNKKSNALEKLIISNKKQKLALDKLTNEMKELNKKKIEKKEDDELIMKEGTSKPNMHYIQDEDMIKALNKMNKLKKQNEKMSNKLYQNEDLYSKAILEDKKKEITEKIENRNNEKIMIIKQLELHQKCINEKNKLNEEFNALKEKLKNIKNDIKNVRIKIGTLINEHNNKNGINTMINLNKNNNSVNDFKSTLKKK